MRAVEYSWHEAEEMPSWWSWDFDADGRVLRYFRDHYHRPLHIRYDNGQLCTFRRKETKR